MSFADKLPKLKAVVQWSGDVPAGSDVTTSDGRTVKYLSFSDMINNEPKTTEQDLDKLLSAQKPGSVCAYIYTSGTTGNPKAVMISHDNIVYEACTVFNLVNKYAGVGTEQERIISYLPLSHVAGMMVDMVGLGVCCFVRQPIIVHFARPYVVFEREAREFHIFMFQLRHKNITHIAYSCYKEITEKQRSNAKRKLNSRSALELQVRSQEGNDQRQTCLRGTTMFLGVPRVWEKIAALKKKVERHLLHLVSRLALSAAPKLWDFSSRKTDSWVDRVLCRAVTVSPPEPCRRRSRKRWVCPSEVRLHGCCLISKETLEFFGVLGININEVYGMSECTGATTVSVDQAHLWEVADGPWRYRGQDLQERR